MSVQSKTQSWVIAALSRPTFNSKSTYLVTVSVTPALQSYSCGKKKNPSMFPPLFFYIAKAFNKERLCIVTYSITLTQYMSLFLLVSLAKNSGSESFLISSKCILATAVCQLLQNDMPCGIYSNSIHYVSYITHHPVHVKHNILYVGIWTTAHDYEPHFHPNT